MKIYKKSGKVRFLPIKKKDLIDLVELVEQGFSPECRIIISTDIDTVSIQENSIEAFYSHNEIPDLLQEYNIYVSSSSDLNPEKLVILNVNGEYFSHLSVSGYDQPWVLGKFQLINDFMDKLFDNYENEKKITTNNEAMAIKYEGDKIIVPNTILEKLAHTSPMAKIGLIIAGITALIGLLQLILMLYAK